VDHKSAVYFRRGDLSCTLVPARHNVFGRPWSDLFLSVALSLTWSFSSWHQHHGATFAMPWFLTDPVFHIPYSVVEVCPMRTVPRMCHAQFSNGGILMTFVAMLGYFSGRKAAAVVSAPLSAPVPCCVLSPSRGRQFARVFCAE
jgi:hypothetical protein